MGKADSRLERKILIATAFFLAALFFFCGQREALAAAGKGAKKGAGKGAAPPVSVFADRVHYEGVHGDILAEGNVRVQQGDRLIVSERVEGNAETKDVWFKSAARFVDALSATDLEGQSASYNYGTGNGRIDGATGKTGVQFITAEEVEILPGKLSGKNVSISRCDAVSHAKCQHIVAKRVDIWPNEKMIAYDVEMYILGKKVLSRKRYIVSLKGGADSNVPRLGYDSGDGAYIKHRLAYPLGENLTAGGDLFAASSAGGRSRAWVEYALAGLRAEYSWGYVEDGDGDWLKQENNVRVSYGNKLFKLPFSYRLWAERGLWKDSRKRSWHREIGAYLSLNKVYFDRRRTLWLALGGGYRKVDESYLAIGANESRYDVGLYKAISPNVMASVLYSDVKNLTDIFDYNRTDVAKSLLYTLDVKIDRLNKITFQQQYDLANNRVYKNRVAYTRKLHCWEVVVRYERERPLGGRYENRLHLELNLAV
jgi:LPS-assembly protein